MKACKAVFLALIAAAVVVCPTPSVKAVDPPECSTSGARYGEVSQWSRNVIDSAGSWVGDNYGQGVKVAVIDSGVSVSSVELRCRVVASADFTGNGPGAREHGTKVAGIIAAEKNTVGVTGVAPGVGLIDARACYDLVGTYADGCSSGSIMRAVVWSVNQGARVINISAGTTNWSTQISGPTAWAAERGVVVVVSAGNSGSETVNPDVSKVTWPAAMPHVIAVAALGENGGRDALSSYGPEVDLAAPTNVLSVSPWQYEKFGGTSAAAPHVAGVAALILQARGSLDPSQVQAVLQASSTPLLLSGSIESTKRLLGAGVLNAGAAVAMARAATFDVQPEIEEFVKQDGGRGGRIVFPDQSWVSRHVGADVWLDSREIGTLALGETYEIPNYHRDARYALSVRESNYTGLSLAGYLKPAISTPIVSSATMTTSNPNAGTGQTVKVYTQGLTEAESELPEVGLLLYDKNGDLADVCSSTDDRGRTSVCYAARPTDANGPYTVRYMTREGVLSGHSAAFNFTGSGSITLSQPEILSFSHTGAVGALVFKRVENTATYGVTVKRPGGFYFSKIGTDGTNLNADSTRSIAGISCEAGLSVVTCLFPVADLEDLEVTVQADRDAVVAGYNSTTSFTFRHRAVITSVPLAQNITAGPVQRSVFGDRINTTYKVKVSWEGATRSDMFYKIYTASGYVGNAVLNQGVWNADVELPAWESSSLDYDTLPVTVVGGLKVGTALYTGNSVTENLLIPIASTDVLSESTSLGCERSGGTVTCSRMSAERIEVRYVSSGGVTTVSSTSSYSFSVDGHNIEVRVRPDAGGVVRTAWVSIPVTETPAETVPTVPDTTSSTSPASPPATQPVLAPETTAPLVGEPPASTPVTSPVTVAPANEISQRGQITAARPVRFSDVLRRSGVGVLSGSKTTVAVARRSVKVCRVSRAQIVFLEDGVCVVEVRATVKNKTVFAKSVLYDSIEDPSRPVAMNHSKNRSMMSVRVGSSIGGRQFASHLEMTFPKSGTISISVSSSQWKTCKVSTGRLLMIKKGSCVVSVQVAVRGRTRLSGTVILQST